MGITAEAKELFELLEGFKAVDGQALIKYYAGYDLIDYGFEAIRPPIEGEDYWIDDE